MEWLLTQAQSAGPFIAVFCLVVYSGVVAILWRALGQKDRTIASMNASQTRAMLASARAMEKLAGKFEKNRR